MEKGMDARAIMEFVPLTESAVARYMRVLEAVHAGRDIDINPRQYSGQTVQDYCEMHGLAFAPRQVVQLEMDDGGPVTVEECMMSIREAFEKFAQAADAFAAAVRGIK
jgi:hypothetical protein